MDPNLVTKKEGLKLLPVLSVTGMTLEQWDSHLHFSGGPVNLDIQEQAIKHQRNPVRL